jgi:hypothetical protein
MHVHIFKSFIHTPLAACNEQLFRKTAEIATIHEQQSAKTLPKQMIIQKTKRFLRA